jgi:hypothetical protein
MTAPDLELQPAVEAAGQALYESFAAQWIRNGANPADQRTWAELPPIEKFNWRKLALPVVTELVPFIARQAFEMGGDAQERAERSGDPETNPWAEPEDWDEAMKRL